MPVDFVVDRRHGVVASRAWGRLSDLDLLAHQRRLGEEPGFQKSWNQLFDLRDVTAMELTGDGIRRLASHNLFGAGARRAFVVRRGALAVFGMMRMFEALTAEHPDELRVQFEHLDDARCYVGLPAAELDASA